MKERTILELRDDARKTLRTFKALCHGQDAGMVHEAFVALAADALLEAAMILDVNEPEHPNCAICRTAQFVKDAAHDVARGEVETGRVEKEMVQ